MNIDLPPKGKKNKKANEEGGVAAESLAANFTAQAASPYQTAFERSLGYAILKAGGADGGTQKPLLWLTSFTDTVALMLTFFVMLYAMSVPEIDKWNEMTNAINEGMSRTPTPESFAGQATEISIDKISHQRGLDLGYLADLIQNQTQSQENLDSILILESKDQLVISLPVELLFGSGNAEIGIEGKRALYVLGGILNKIRNRIEVIGHADPRPIREKRQYESNWELSLARALTVASLLKEVGYQRDIAVRGLSSARYNEIVGGTDEVTQMQNARRVDIVIMKDDGNTRSFIDVSGSG